MMIEDNRPADQRLRDAGVVHLLQIVWTYPITTKSDTARLYADEIAEAASRQLVTTAVVPPNKAKTFGRIWKVTPEGLTFLFANADVLFNEESDYVATFCR